MKKRQRLFFAGFFLSVLILFALVSDLRLLDYYVNDPVYNEDWIPDLGRKNETDYNTVFFGKNMFLDINGGMRRLFGQREMNGVVRLKNGQLTALKGAIDEKTLRSEADRVGQLYEYLRSEGIPFLYVATPDKISPYDDELPAGENDAANQNTDIFLDELSMQGVPFLDMRAELHDAGIDPYELFFVTDHHWEMTGGFFAAQRIMDWVSENTAMEKEDTVLSAASYQTASYPDAVLGSWGQRVGRFFGGVEDLEILYPDFETDLVRQWDKSEGSYAEVLIDESVIVPHKPQFIYDAVFGGSYGDFLNRSKETGSMLVITDSMGKVVNPFLILSVKDFYCLSSYQPESLTPEYIEERKPQVVILMQSPWNNLGSDAGFQFGVLTDAD